MSSVVQVERDSDFAQGFARNEVELVVLWNDLRAIGLLVSAYLIDVEQTVCDEVLVDRELPRAENLTLQAMNWVVCACKGCHRGETHCELA